MNDRHPSRDHPIQHRDGFLLTSDPGYLQLDVIHGYLENSYWAGGIPLEVVQRSVQHSLCFGIYEANREHASGRIQIAFARVVTDYATFAYLGDVFVLESYRGRGLSVWMMEFIHAHPRLQGLRRWCLNTDDAHGLYAKVGWKPTTSPEGWMEIVDREVYRSHGEE